MTKDLPFTNREITAMFDSIERKLDEHAEVHAQILEQVKATNGKVAEIQRWRERMIGAAWVGGVVVTVIIIPLATWAVLVVNSIDKKIVEALDNYEISISE